MTSSKDTNDPHRYGKGMSQSSNNENEKNSKNFEDDWLNFITDHSDELKDISNSRDAKSFEKHAKKKENAQNFYLIAKNSRGPRDNTRTSWLDVDTTMDEYGDNFVPPNPKLEDISPVTFVLWTVFAVGIAGIILSAFLPSLATIVGIISAILMLLGGLGIFLNRKKPDPYKEDYRDYGHGARV